MGLLINNNNLNNLNNNLTSNTTTNTHNTTPSKINHRIQRHNRIQNNTKLTSGNYIPQEAINKLNLNLNNNNINNNNSSNINNNNNSSNITTTTPQINSPQSFQSQFFDDNYNSEDSFSSQSSNNSNSAPICLIPKHQQKKNNINNNNNNLNNNSNNTHILSPINILHDDTDVKDSPDQHVDYLTHKWKEDEISKSWKYVTLRRSAVADSARLENASWRTWAQTRLNLKTISPEELNWSKENDVTWLYGPVITHDNETNFNDNDTNNNNNNNNETYETTPNDEHDNIISPNDHLKSILKKKSNVEKVISEASYSKLQHLLENRENRENKEKNFKFPSNSVSASNSITSSPMIDPTITNDPKFSPLMTNTNFSDSIIIPSHNLISPSPLPSNSSSYDNTNNNTNSDQSNNKILPSRIKSSLKTTSLLNNNNNNNNNLNTTPLTNSKHIHFNMRVDQCIAINDSDDYNNKSDDDYPIDKMVSSKYHEDHENNHFYSNDGFESDIDIDDNENDNDNYNGDDEKDFDEGFVLTPTIHVNISHKPNDGNNNNNNSNSNERDIITIAPLPATTLKFGSDDELDYPNDYNNNNSNYNNYNNNKMYTVSHNTKTNRGYDYYYDYNTVYSNNSNPTIYKPTETIKEKNNNNNMNNNIDTTDNTDDDDVEMYDVPVDFQMNESNTSINNLTGFPVYSYNDGVNIPSSDPAPLKRTESIGSKNSSQSLSSIKVGLSGLDLSKTGLKSSTGLGSKPQLFQLSQRSYDTPSQFIPKPQSLTNNRNKFLFDDSDDDSDDLMIDDNNDYQHNEILKFVKSGSSLSELNNKITSNPTIINNNNNNNNNNTNNNTFDFGSDSESDSESD